MPPCHGCLKTRSVTRHLNYSCGVSQLKDSALSLPRCWSTGERGGVLCMMGEGCLEPYVLDALGRKQSAVGQQYFGTQIQSENTRLKPPLFSNHY